VAVRLESVQDGATVFELGCAYLLFAFAAKGHGAEDDGESCFGRHVDALLVVVWCDDEGLNCSVTKEVVRFMYPTEE
jgi:hypothetical protein